MTTMLPFARTLSLALLFHLVTGASLHAGGSFHVEDITPVLSQQPKAWAAIQKTFETPEYGLAQRIGGSVNPNLGGARLGPYQFPARLRSESVEDKQLDFENAPYVVEIITEVRFLNDAGEEVELPEAMRIEEKLVGFMVRESAPFSGD